MTRKQNNPVVNYNGLLICLKKKKKLKKNCIALEKCAHMGACNMRIYIMRKGGGFAFTAPFHFQFTIR